MNDSATHDMGFDDEGTEGHGRRLLGGVANWGGWLALLAVLVLPIGWGVRRLTAQAAASVQDRPLGQIAQQDYDAPVGSLAFAGDAHLAAATITGEVWLQDLARGGSSLLVSGPPPSGRSLAVSPAGRLLAVADGRASLRLWDATTAEERDEIEIDGRKVRRVAFAPDGTRLALVETEGAGAGDTVALWDGDHRRRIAALEGRFTAVGALAFAPDGARLAAIDNSGRVTIWDAATGRERLSFRAWEGNPSTVAIAFSPDGTLLATSCLAERGARLWDVASGAPRGAVPATASINALAFSPDGTLLALAGDDGSTALWTPSPARERGAVRAPGGRLQTAAFSPDGRVLATGGMDGVVRLWDVAQVLGGPRPGSPGPP